MLDADVYDGFEGTDAEMAQALIGLRQTPGAALQGRVLAIARQRRRPRVPRLAWIGVAVALALGLLLSSPTVRATLGEVEKVVGHIYLTVTDGLPFNSEAARLVEGSPVSLTVAQEQTSFTFGLPAYLPDGYEMVDGVAVWRPNDVVADVVQITWRNADGHLLELSAHAYDPGKPIHTIVGPESSETVQVNGEDAALVRGGWDQPSGDWRHQDETASLLWVYEGVQYSLLAYGGDLSAEELVATAESVR